MKIVKEHKPDIILTDIRMPELNGLDMIQRLNEEDPDISCVIISGYQEFEFVKRALQYGVADYLLKPVRKEDLNRAIDEIIRKKELLNHDRTEKRDIQETKDVHKYKMRKLFVENIVKEYLSDSETDRDYLEKEYCCDLSGERFAMFGIKLHLINNWPQKNDETNFIINWKGQIEAQWQKESSTFLCCAVEQDVLYGFINLRNEEYADVRQDVKKIVGNILRKSGQAQNLKYTIGFSSLHKDVSTFFKMAKEVRSAIYDRFIPGNSQRVILFNDIEKRHDIYDFISIKMQNQIFSNIKKMNFDEIENIAESIRGEILARNVKSGKTVLDIWTEFLRIILIGCRDIMENEKREEMDRVYLYQLRNCCTEKELYSKLKFLIDRMRSIAQKSLQERMIHPVKMAKEYIDTNYMKECSASEVSRAVGLNEDDFSLLFRKEEGMEFDEYVSAMRIRKAKKMLMEKGIKIIEIAYRTGYDNEKNFSKAFKKYTELTPGEYRKLYS